MCVLHACQLWSVCGVEVGCVRGLATDRHDFAATVEPEPAASVVVCACKCVQRDRHATAMGRLGFVQYRKHTCCNSDLPSHPPTHPHFTGAPLTLLIHASNPTAVDPTLVILPIHPSIYPPPHTVSAPPIYCTVSTPPSLLSVPLHHPSPHSF